MLYDDWITDLEYEAWDIATDEYERTPLHWAEFLYSSVDGNQAIAVPNDDDLTPCSVDQLLVALFNAPDAVALRARHLLRERFLDDSRDYISDRVTPLVEDELRYEQERAEP